MIHTTVGELREILAGLQDWEAVVVVKKKSRAGKLYESVREIESIEITPCGPRVRIYTRKAK